MTTHEAKSGVGSRTAVKVITFLSLTKWSIFLSRCYCECSDCVWSESQKCRVSKRLQLIMRVKWFKHLHSELNRKCDGDCELRLSSPALRESSGYGQLTGRQGEFGLRISGPWVTISYIVWQVSMSLVRHFAQTIFQSIQCPEFRLRSQTCVLKMIIILIPVLVW